ncbi:MAG: hypothetical protein ACI9C1_001391 [Candidatus Aldehydirespiratoraceae bacterium]|jgi:hypothetical protein
MVIDWGDSATETVSERTPVEHEIRTVGLTAVQVLAADHGERDVWDLVYTDGAGDRIEPGDADHPTESDWYVSSRSNLRRPLISLHGRWAGIQPGSATAFVTVNDLGVSEHVDGHANGCT